MELSIETAAGIVSVIGLTVLVLKRLDVLHFGKPQPAPQAEVPIPTSCPDPECSDRLKHLLEDRIERSKKTSGALHISEEALGKIQILEQNYLSRDSHKELCRANLLELKGEIKDLINDRLKETEEKLLKAINGGVKR